MVHSNPMLLDADAEFLRHVGKWLKDGYRYMEVGVFFGQSLPYQALNPKCSWITAVDLYPDEYPDERHKTHKRPIGFDKAKQYLNERKVPLDKIEFLQCDLADVTSHDRESYDFIFIDAEHTNEAAFRDGVNAMWHIDDLSDTLIVFHDTTLVYGAIDCYWIYLQQVYKVSRPVQRFKIRNSELTAFYIGENEDIIEFCRKRSTDYDTWKVNAKLRLADQVQNETGRSMKDAYDRS